MFREADFEIAIRLASAKISDFSGEATISGSPSSEVGDLTTHPWWDTFNLALYHTAAGNTEAAQNLYQSAAPTAPREWIDMALQDLADLQIILPHCALAQQMQELLSA